MTPPAQRVQFILGEDIDADGTTLESHPLFSEMDELVKDGDEIEWKETARWVKFEEDVEEGGNRWSKPHVATLSLHSLFELRSLILNGSIMLDMEAATLDQIADLVCENMVNAGSLPMDSREKVRDALLRKHRHQHEQVKKNNMSRLPLIRSLADIGKNHSTSKSKSNIHLSIHTLSHPTSNIHFNVYKGFLESRKKLPKTTSHDKDERGVYIAVPEGLFCQSSPSNQI